MEIALIPVVPAPRLVGDVLDDEALIRRKLDEPAGTVAAGLDRCLEDGVQLLSGDDEVFFEGGIAIDDRAFSRQGLVELVENPLEMAGTVGGCDGIEQGSRFVVEFSPCTCNHAGSCREGVDRFGKSDLPLALHGIVGGQG